MKWDPRLDDLGVRLERAGTEPRWRLVEAEYWDDAQSGGKHHIYIKALRQDGTPAAGVRFVADWIGRRPDETPGLATTDERGEANLPMFINFDPHLKNGVMFATVDGAAADTVTGMGLPWNHHVCFVLTFQEQA